MISPLRLWPAAPVPQLASTEIRQYASKCLYECNNFKGKLVKRGNNLFERQNYTAIQIYEITRSKFAKKSEIISSAWFTVHHFKFMKLPGLNLQKSEIISSAWL